MNLFVEKKVMAHRTAGQWEAEKGSNKNDLNKDPNFCKMTKVSSSCW